MRGCSGGGLSVLPTSVCSLPTLCPDSGCLCRPSPRSPLPGAVLASPPGSCLCQARAHSLSAECSVLVLTCQQWTWHSLGEGLAALHWNKPTFALTLLTPRRFYPRGRVFIAGRALEGSFQESWNDRIIFRKSFSSDPCCQRTENDKYLLS